MATACVTGVPLWSAEIVQTQTQKYSDLAFVHWLTLLSLFLTALIWKHLLKVSDILNSITMLIKLTTIKLSGLMLIYPVNKSSVMSRMSFLCLFCSLFVFKLRQCETLKINRIKFHHLKINLKMVNAGKQSWE